jgi:hypothetical protein
MKRIFLPALAAALFIVPALAQTPDKLDLARRVLSTTTVPLNASLEKLLPAMTPKQDPWVAEAPEVFLAGLRKVLANNAPRFQRLDEARAKAIAAAFSEDEMRAILAYTESPWGKSFEEKKRVADGAADTSGAITPEEQAARDAYDQGAGKIYAAKSKNALESTGEDAAFITFKVIGEARLEFCNRTDKCPANVVHDLKGMVELINAKP